MTEKLFSLDIIEVASPCTADWEKMRGTDKVRHCGQCDLNVYHLSNMNRDEAETLVREQEGRICVRFYRRADGTVLTRDCPVGLRAIRRQLARLVAGVAAMIAFLVGGIAAGLNGLQSKPKSPNGYVDPRQLFPRYESGPIGSLTEWLDPRVPKYGGFMGVLESPANQTPVIDAPPATPAPNTESVPAGSY